MIIARSVKEIDEILEYFVKDGFEGPTVIIDKKQGDLFYWKDCMIEEFKKKSLLIFETRCQWDNQEFRVRKFLHWYAPETLEEYKVEG